MVMALWTKLLLLLLLLLLSEKSLEEYATLLPDKDKNEIKSDLENLKKQLTTNDPTRMRDAIKQLEGSAYRIADAIYNAESKK